MGGTQIPCLTAEREARCLLPAGMGSRHRLWRQLWLPSGSGISLLFSASPLPFCSNSSPAFPFSHFSPLPFPPLIFRSPVIGGCLLHGGWVYGFAAAGEKARPETEKWKLTKKQRTMEE